MARPPFWKRKYLLEPKLQIGVTFYLLLFSLATLLIIYISLNQSLSAVFENSTSLSSACHEIIESNQENVQTILLTVFWTNAVVLSIFAIAGGILISHRIVGPIFRFKKALRQILNGEDPGEIRLRKSDYFSDLIPLLQELQRSRKTEKID